MRIITIAAAALLAGCAVQPDSPAVGVGDSSEPASGAEAPADAAVASIQGRWQVERVDGAAPVINIADYAPVVTIGAERIHFQSQCIYADWTYRRDGNALTTAPYFEPGSGMCARALAPGETAIQAVLDKATRVFEGPGDTMVIEGVGHRIELRRTELRSDGRVGIASLAGEWRVAGINGGDFNKSYGLALSGNERELWWEPRCAGMVRRYRLTGGTITFSPPVEAPPAAGPTRPVCTIGLPPRLDEVMRAIDAATTIARTDQNGVLISGGGRSLLLFSQ